MARSGISAARVPRAFTEDAGRYDTPITTIPDGDVLWDSLVKPALAVGHLLRHLSQVIPAIPEAIFRVRLVRTPEEIPQPVVIRNIVPVAHHGESLGVRQECETEGTVQMQGDFPTIHVGGDAEVSVPVLLHAEDADAIVPHFPELSVVGDHVSRVARNFTPHGDESNTTRGM